MLALDTTSRKLQVLLGGAVATNELAWLAVYVDLESATWGVVGEGAVRGVTTGATPVDVVGSPGTGNIRNIKTMSVRNRDTVSQTLYVRYEDGGTPEDFMAFLLSEGDALMYEDGKGFAVIDKYGNLKSAVTTFTTPADGDKGDITVSSSGTVWTIDPNVVTYSKIQQVAAATLLGNPTGATANVSGVTLSTGLAFSGSTLLLATLSDGGTGSFVKISRDTYGRVSGTTAVVAGDISALVDARYVRQDVDTTLANGVTIVLNGGTTSFSTNDLVPKWYVDDLAAGRRDKQAVRLASTVNVNISNPGTAVFDGGTANNGDRILLKNQSASAENGAYVFNGSGSAMTRAPDSNSSAEMTSGVTYWVTEGATQADTGWTLITDDPITLDTTALTFTQTSGLGQVTAGAALTKTGNTLDVSVDGSTIEISSDALRVKDNGVSLAKIVDISAQYRVLGRITAGAGDPEELTPNNLITVVNQGSSAINAARLTASGSTTQVQFNDGGAFGGDAEFTYDKTNNVLNPTHMVQKTSIPSGEAVTVPAGHQMVVGRRYTVTGSLVLSGDLHIL